ncbi:MAG: Rieske 2Fe-2S domain-containing protein [Chloroflexi bacterium]|nr:Rieske 2Fe-2S domain-containing protein [Chloroflexota bacterium]
MSVALAIVGVSILGTWGIATISLIVGGIILLVAPADVETTSSALAVGIFLLIAGLISGGLMQVIAMPLMGLDPPLPMKAKDNIPHERMQGWANAGPLRGFPDGIATEVRLHSFRVAIVRQGEEAYAMAALCPHARLPLGSFPGAPIKPEPIRDGCVMCPFHGARFDVSNGNAVRQPFASEFNANHPFLGAFQSKLFFWNKGAEDIQTYPVRIENDEVIVGLPR